MFMLTGKPQGCVMSEDGDAKGTDQAMLLALMNRGRDTALLSAEQEKLLDDWMADRLPAADVDRAEALAKNNAFAAERILENRLMAAARNEPPVPAELTGRILKMASPPTPKRFGFRWPALGTWQWSGLAGALAAAMAVVVFGIQQFTANARIQVAMVTVSDRSVLFEASDVRMRGAQQPSIADRRFREVEVPTEIIRHLADVANTRVQGAAAQAIIPFLGSTNETGGTAPNVVVDAALSQKVAAAGDRKPFTVRIYNLEDPRNADIRVKLEPLPTTGRIYFLTLKP
jgi:hypothetical protein